MIAVLSLALATESTGYAGTFFLPEARERAAGEVVATVGTGAAIFGTTSTCLAAEPAHTCGGPYFDVVGVPVARLAWAPSAGTRLEALGGVSPGGGGTVMFDAATSVPISDVSRVGVFGGVFAAWYADAGAEGAYAIGLNYSAQWSGSRFDVAVPILGGALEDPAPTLAALAGSEAAFSFDLGKGHALRAGMLSLLPGGGWQYSGERLLARVDVHSLGVVSAVRAEVGARF